LSNCAPVIFRSSGTDHAKTIPIFIVRAAYRRLPARASPREHHFRKPAANIAGGRERIHYVAVGTARSKQRAGEVMAAAVSVPLSPKRWIVERTLGWLVKSRPLVATTKPRPNPAKP